jgi:hypothetical protein
MKTERAIQMTLFAGALATVLMIGAPRPAHASDAGKIIGVIAAGVILHEILDNDNDRCPACQRPYYGRPYGRACGQSYGFLETRPRCSACRGYGGWQSAPPGYRAPAFYGPTRSGVRIDVHRDPCGRTSVGIDYRGRRR